MYSTVGICWKVKDSWSFFFIYQLYLTKAGLFLKSLLKCSLSQKVLEFLTASLSCRRRENSQNWQILSGHYGSGSPITRPSWKKGQILIFEAFNKTFNVLSKINVLVLVIGKFFQIRKVGSGLRFRSGKDYSGPDPCSDGWMRPFWPFCLYQSKINCPALL